ncbi:MAG TPA: DUF5333 family protein [Paracoccaceae bacterium]|nr:DUF5333 family protein [Paracoccaceae bacterium]HMO71317.1 DUF5333 family protein [Paracoccaceae bacterium]
MKRIALTLSLILSLAAPLAAAAPVPLAQEKHINSELLAAQIGDILRRTCPAASARMFVVLNRLNALESYARSKGYAEAEVKAFLKDRAQKDRIRAEAQAWLAAAGASPGDPESHCRVAREEVRKRSAVGSLLRVSG